MNKAMMRTVFAGVRKPAKQIQGNIIVFTDREREPLKAKTIQSYERLTGELIMLMRHYDVEYLLISHSYSDKQYSWDHYDPDGGNTIRVRCDHSYGWGSQRGDREFDERLLDLINQKLYEMSNHRRVKILKKNDDILNQRMSDHREKLQRELDAKLDKMMKPYKRHYGKRHSAISERLPERNKLKTYDLMRDNTYRFSVGLKPREDMDETEE